MKQPELGIKIAELRKSKGLTQEELVDRCNISVRTLQRIEAGEVTPRAYTVKTILGVLDYDFSEIYSRKDNKLDSFARWLKNLIFIDIDPYPSTDFTLRQLNLAMIFGILYFIQFFFHGAIEHFRLIEEGILFNKTEPSKYFQFLRDRIGFNYGIYISIKLVGLITFVYFQRGFILIGGIVNNYLLRIISFILICFTLLLTIYDITSLFYDSLERHFILGGTALAFGVIGIIYGISLNRLHKSVGIIAKYAGILEIIAGCFFLTIVLAFFNFAVFIPARILEIIIIFKMIELIKTKETEQNMT